eukprot:SM000354S13406  [mRNA]  locus=s354:23220:24746:- [translate_table: standard]
MTLEGGDGGAAAPATSGGGMRHRHATRSSLDGKVQSGDSPTVCESFPGGLVQYEAEPRYLSATERRIRRALGGPVLGVLRLSDFASPEVWRASVIELVATASLVFTSVTGTIACLEGGFLPPGKAVGLVNAGILALHILAAGPSSGGHINPSITFSTMLTGLTSFPRAVLYILAQTGGAIIGAAVAQGVLPHATAAKYFLGGCLLEQPSHGSGAPMMTGLRWRPGLLSEFAFTFVLLFVAFGTALDAKQGQIFGPVLSPFLIGGTLGLLIFVSSGLVAGYVGAGMNPARCFGPAVAMGSDVLWRDNWVFWVGPGLACCALAFVYHLIPPHHADVYRERRDVFSVLRSGTKPPVLEVELEPNTHNGL